MDPLGFAQSGFDESQVAERSPCGRYIRYNKIFGRGAFKDVYKGFDRVSNTEIAWYQISLDGETSISLENQLCSEAVLLKSLDHKNIIKCYSYWVDYTNKCTNMIVEFFASGSLRHYLKSFGAVDLPRIRDWGRQILQGLQYLHMRSPRIVHRDVKCDNVFIDVANGEIKIGDFGLAAAMEEEEKPLHAVTGTPEFMAPEYYDEEYNESVDVYAFGMCLMELATCQCPYSECTNAAQIFKKVSSGIKPAGLEKVKDVEVKGIIEKCLLLPASLRPSASELLKDPFFLVEIENPMKIGRSCGDSIGSPSSCLEVAIAMDSMESVCGPREENYCRGDSILSGVSALFVMDSMESIYCSRGERYYMDDSILSGVSALFDMDTMESVRGPGEESRTMDDSILSGVSALYDTISVQC